MESSNYFGSPKNKALWEKHHPYLEQVHPCVVCNSTRFETWAKLLYLEAKSCLECGMISINPHFSEKGLTEFYADYFSHRQEDVLKKQDREITYEIDRNWVELFVDGGKVLDVGSSGGFFLSKFSKEKWDRQGVEISPDAADFAEKNFGIQVHVGSLLDLDFKEKFDLVMLRGTIEHFHDPVRILEKCCQLLRPGGSLFITATPAGDSFAFQVYREKWGLFTPLEHIHFFSVKTLSRLLKNFGMRLFCHHYQYEETPYANPSKDFKKIKDDIYLIRQGRADEIMGSVPFPGSIVTALWQKS